MGFAVPADHRVRLKKNEKKDKYLGLQRELKKLWNMKVTVVPIIIAALCTVTKRFGKSTKGIRNHRTSGGNPNYNNAEIGENTGKSPGDLRRLVVTQIPVKDRLTLMWKILKE